MQRIYKKAREVYPDWNPFHGMKMVEGLMEINKFIDTFNEIYPETKWTPIDDFGEDPMFRGDLRSVIISNGFNPKETARIFSMNIGSFFFKPNEVLHGTGTYFLPQIVPSRSFQPIRSIIQTFDVDRLIDMKHGDPGLVPTGMITAKVHMDKNTWKTLIKEKYFGDVESQIDQMLDNIYDLEQHPPQPTAELLGRVMIRIHKDDYETGGILDVSEYFTSDEAKGEAYIEKVT